MSAAPENSAPDGTTPDGTAPDGSAPDGTAPDGTGGAAPARRRNPVRWALDTWRWLYGSNPLHLLVLVGSFALVYGVFLYLEPDPTFPLIALWFVGAVIAHDLLLYPLYALADRTLVATRWVRRRVIRRTPLVPATNHVRLPVLGSALMFGVFWPSIGGGGEEAYRFASGSEWGGYYDNWLIATGVLFLASAVIYALRLGAAGAMALHARSRRTSDGSTQEVGDPAVT